MVITVSTEKESDFNIIKSFIMELPDDKKFLIIEELKKYMSDKFLEAHHFLSKQAKESGVTREEALNEIKVMRK